MDYLDDPEYKKYDWKKIENYMDIFEIYYGFFNDGELIKDCVAITLDREIIGMFNIDSNTKHFTISSTKAKPNNIMHIVVDSNYQSLGITKKLMINLINKIREKYSAHVTDKTLLSIVGDASGGFWEHIGMKGDEHYKDITINNLEKYLKINQKAGLLKKKTKRKKSTKKKKSTKRKKSLQSNQKSTKKKNYRRKY